MSTFVSPSCTTRYADRSSAGGSGTGSPSTCTFTVSPVRRTSSTSGPRSSSPGCGARSSSSSASRIAPSSPRISRQRLPAGVLGRPQRLLLLRQRGRQRVPDRADLEHDHADRVRDHVVHLAGDAGALLGHRQPGGRLPLALGTARALLRPTRAIGHHAARVTGRPRRARTTPARTTRSAGACPGSFRTTSADAGHHDGEADPRLGGVRHPAQQERGRDTRATAAPVAKTMSRPSTKETAAAATHTAAGAPNGYRRRRQQRQHRERRHGHREPRAGLRGARGSCRRATSSALAERQQDDDGVQARAARRRRVGPRVDGTRGDHRGASACRQRRHRCSDGGPGSRLGRDDCAGQRAPSVAD